MKTHTYNNYQIKKKNPKRNTTCTQFFNSIVKLEPDGLGKTNKSLIGQLLFSLWVQCNGSDISNHNFFLSSPSHPIHLARDASSPSPQTLHFEHSITFGCCPVCVETSCLSSRENKKLESSWVNKRKKNPIFYFYIWKLFMVCYNNSGWLHVYF